MELEAFMKRLNPHFNSFVQYLCFLYTLSCRVIIVIYFYSKTFINFLPMI